MAQPELFGGESKPFTTSEVGESLRDESLRDESIVAAELQTGLDAEGAKFTQVRDKAGELLRVYFGKSPAAQKLNEINRAEHPQT